MFRPLPVQYAIIQIKLLILFKSRENDHYFRRNYNIVTIQITYAHTGGLNSNRNNYAFTRVTIGSPDKQFLICFIVEKVTLINSPRPNGSIFYYTFFAIYRRYVITPRDSA